MRSYSKYGEIIRRLRKQKDLSQEGLAERAHVDPKTVIQIESGQRNPTLKTLQKIASALKVGLKELIP
jgi:transcriptional regulator with XRE-family HTH domain